MCVCGTVLDVETCSSAWESGHPPWTIHPHAFSCEKLTPLLVNNNDAVSVCWRSLATYGI